jgi:tetratricopeptide (TPR) repeat protein
MAGARNHAIAANKIATQLGDTLGSAKAREIQGYATYMRGDTAGGRAMLESALAQAKRAGDPNVTAKIYGSLGLTHHDQGNVGQAKEYYDKELESAKAGGDPKAISTAFGHQGYAQRDLGQASRALESFQAARVQAIMAQDKAMEGQWATQTGAVLENLGRNEEAKKAYGDGLDLASGAKDNWNQTLAHLGLGRIDQRAGN